MSYDKKFRFLLLNSRILKYMFYGALFVSRLRDYQSFMKYAVILILDVERSSSKLSRLVRSYIMLAFANAFQLFLKYNTILNELIFDIEAPVVVYASHGRLCQRCSPGSNSSKGSGMYEHQYLFCSVIFVALCMKYKFVFNKHLVDYTVLLVFGETILVF